MRQRAELLPYIYNASYTAYLHGIQLVRSMYIDYPNELNAYPSINDVVKQQYMFGDAMIVSPIATQGDLYNMTKQNIFLPSTEDFYERHSGYVIQQQSSKSISRGFSLSEIPIYIRTDSIIPILPFNKKNALGRANEVNYKRLRFDIFPSLNAVGSNSFVYEDDGISFDYLNESAAALQTGIEWKFDSSSFEFTASIVSTGHYDGFDAERYYGVRIYNVLSPKNVYCNDQEVAYNLLYFDEWDKENTFYFDGVEMALTVNCPKTMDAFGATVIKIEFARDWSVDFKYTSLYGMKGKISRANQCKACLDEVNYPYGNHIRSNMSSIASYSMLLGNVGNDYAAQFEYVQQFDAMWQNALDEVKNLDEKVAGSERYAFCNDLYDTISV